MNAGQLVGMILGGVGGVMLLAGLWWGLAVRGFTSRAQRATGEVTALVPRASRGSSTRTTSITYAPAVRFHTPDGQQVDFVSAVSSSRGTQVGTSVEVLYLAGNPKKAKINSFVHLWLGPMIILLIGGVLAVVGAAIWLSIG